MSAETQEKGKKISTIKLLKSSILRKSIWDNILYALNKEIIETKILANILLTYWYKNLTSEQKQFVLKQLKDIWKAIVIIPWLIILPWSSVLIGLYFYLKNKKSK